MATQYKTIEDYNGVPLTSLSNEDLLKYLDLSMKDTDEALTIAVNLYRTGRRAETKMLSPTPCYRIGKGLFYLHFMPVTADGNSRQIKYTLCRPDINYSESGSFDYVAGWDLRDYLSDIYYGKNFEDF